MNQNLFFDAMEFIDDDMIEAVNVLRMQKKNKKNRIWIPIASAAACICIVASGLSVGMHYLHTDKKSTDNGENLNNTAEIMELESFGGVTIPKTQVTLNANTTADMMAFFIFEGRIYMQNEWIKESSALVGEYVGTATGMIDEWTPKDGYVDCAGSISGDFYTVNGYDPDFMLCMKDDDGSVSTYINDNGLTLRTGSDLFEDRLHLAGNYSAIEYQARTDWFYSLDNIKTLYSESALEAAETVEKFITALNAGSFMYVDDIPLEKGQTNLYDLANYHLFFRMDNGMNVHLLLYEGGYVRYSGLIPVCVKMEESAFNELFHLLN